MSHRLLQQILLRSSLIFLENLSRAAIISREPCKYIATHRQSRRTDYHSLWFPMLGARARPPSAGHYMTFLRCARTHTQALYCHDSMLALFLLMPATDRLIQRIAARGQEEVYKDLYAKIGKRLEDENLIRCFSTSLLALVVFPSAFPFDYFEKRIVPGERGKKIAFWNNIHHDPERLFLQTPARCEVVYVGFFANVDTYVKPGLNHASDGTTTDLIFCKLRVIENLYI